MLLDVLKKSDYEIATALRGPDNESDRAKCLFTAVIRGLVYPISRCYDSKWQDFYSHAYAGSYVNTMQYARKVAAEWTPFDIGSLHFLEHAQSAFRALAEIKKSNDIIDYWNWALTKVELAGYTRNRLMLMPVDFNKDI